MTKPKNMTPEQEAEWKERRRQRQNTPEAKAKAKARFDEWYRNKGGREKVIANVAAQRRTPEGQERRKEENKRRLAKPEVRERMDQINRDWKASPKGQAAQKRWSKAYYDRKGEAIKQRRKDDRAFTHFLKTIGENVE